MSVSGDVIAEEMWDHFLDRLLCEGMALAEVTDPIVLARSAKRRRRDAAAALAHCRVWRVESPDSIAWLYRGTEAESEDGIGRVYFIEIVGDAGLIKRLNELLMDCSEHGPA